jgi:hypothetical protein
MTISEAVALKLHVIQILRLAVGFTKFKTKTMSGLVRRVTAR